MDIHLEILSQKTREVTEVLNKESFLDNFYLAGGTGLALQIVHRKSYDLDFFSQENFDESLILQKLSSLGEFQLDKKSEQSIVGSLGETKISFLGYKYPLLRAFKEVLNIKVADILDIACMKIDAIASRGTKRDFIDVYFIAKEFTSLDEILLKFEEKYSSLNYNNIHIKKSLVYFEDAEKDPMPIMIKSVEWDNVKSFFEKKVAKL